MAELARSHIWSRDSEWVPSAAVFSSHAQVTLHEKCSLQLGWELAGEDATRDRAGMSVEELIDFGETEAENRDLVLWLQGYMDPYEGEIDTAKYSRAEIVDKLLFN